MFLIRSSATDLRQGWTRRDCLRVGLGGAFAFLANSLRSSNRLRAGNMSQVRSFGQAKSCILIYLFGGPSHIDIWDLKPLAPPEIRGEFKPQATNVPGIQITEHLPDLVALAINAATISGAGVCWQ